MKKLTVIPLATPQTLPPRSIERLRSVQGLFFQTLEHPCTRYALQAAALNPESVFSMDEYYNGSFDFDELNDTIAARLVSAFDEDGIEDIGFAVLGRGAGAALMDRLAPLLSDRGIALFVLPSCGFADAALAAAFGAGLGYFTDYGIRTAQSLAVSGTERPLVIEECDTILRAGEVKLQLSEYYPDEFEIFIASMDERGEYAVKALPLYTLDRVENAALYGAATVLIIPSCPLTRRNRHGFEALMEVMHRLRAPGGCPWDAEQTHASLRSSLIEESYEVLDAIDRDDMTALEEELGDLLLQVVFHAVIEEERSEFTMRDVVTGIVNKLIYRHPHVFGDVKVNSSDDVLYNWENLKKKEKHQETVADAMRAVPAAFPALMRSYKIQKKAAHVGFDWKSAKEALPKVTEEASEVLEAINSGDPEHTSEEVGDLLFACVNVARLLKVDPELALGAATDKFMRRFISMEQLILSEGLDFGNMTLEEMDRYWEMVKKTV
ncbi:MAG: nucleoside triphosphate pyrophosphohydrolase [Clostridia bacterium]|nr:nucleoside triphosphate pyrophosphohydrolase [Clostridia bacterium]